MLSLPNVTRKCLHKGFGTKDLDWGMTLQAEET